MPPARLGLGRRCPAPSPPGSTLSERFGKLPFADLLEPAIEYARAATACRRSSPQKWAAADAAAPSEPGFAERSCRTAARPKVGERFAFPARRATLRAIAATSGEAFYRGEIAEAMVAHAQANGGAHDARATSPRHAPSGSSRSRIDYRGSPLHEIPPNGQGIAALIALGILRHFDIAAHAASTAPSRSTCRSRR